MNKPSVLVFAGNDPSGGAGISADIGAITAQGAHALPIITAITVQDNDHVWAVHPVAFELIVQQAQALANKITISAIKIGIVASRTNASAIAQWITELKKQYPALPVVVDPVLASGGGNALSKEDAVSTLQPLLPIATLITPNLPEAAQLCRGAHSIAQQAQQLMRYGVNDILIKGGHGTGDTVTNTWFHHDQLMSWQWPRYSGSFHGSGCTLAAAIAAQLACDVSMQTALENAQNYCQRSLQQAYAIASGQLIPRRNLHV